MDKLEEYILKNREALDRYNPPSGVRRKFMRELNHGRPAISRWMKVAAMLAIVLGSAVLIFRHADNARSLNEGISAQNREAVDEPQLRETEIYYNNLVNTLYSQATPLLTGNPELASELNSGISQIDSICADIRKDLRDNVANQEVVEALIRNYQIKIRLLEDMLAILKEQNASGQKSNGYEL